MTTLRNTRDDVVRAAGRLFAERGYHGTSMRDLGRELGLHGSSLYSHISSKEDLLVDVVMRGADLFEAAARSADGADPPARLEALVAAHVDVLLDHIDESRTFLNEARALEDEHRSHVVDARDRYEEVFRQVLADGVSQGAFRSDLDVRMSTIYVLSILNAIDRWYRVDGDLDRPALVESLMTFVLEGIASHRGAHLGGGRFGVAGSIGDVHDLTPGIENVEQVTVTAEMSPPHLAPTIVLSTPKMIELMEWAATRAVQPALGDTRTSVGTHVDVSHEAAARQGELVTVRATLSAVDRRRLTFSVSVKVGDRVIGRGTHERFVIDRERFG